MADTRDYQGKRFGRFRIGRNIAHGREAEVFLCLHRDTGRCYVLRLDVEDDTIWEKDPVLPPHNYTLERENVNATWALALAYYRRPNIVKLFTTRVCYVPIYGILENRYLVPVASPIRVKSSWSVDRVLKTIPADDARFELWEDFLRSMITDAFNEAGEPSPGWKERWGRLLGGRILVNSMKRYLDEASLNREQKSQIISHAARFEFDGPEFAENLLLRLCGCICRGKMTYKEAKATLRCIHFRINVTGHDLIQILAVYSALRETHTKTKTSIDLLKFIVHEMKRLPLDEYTNTRRFEARANQPDAGQFLLFLQEYAGTPQQVVRLESRFKYFCRYLFGFIRKHKRPTYIPFNEIYKFEK